MPPLARPRLAALAALALLALPAGAGGPDGYDATGCHYVYAPFVADAAVARAMVPPDYALPGEPAAATLVLTTAQCDVSVAGGPPAETFFTDIGILAVPPGGGPGVHLYWLWHASRNDDLRALFAARGAPVAPTDRVGFGFGGDPYGALTVAVAVSGWDEGGFELTGFFLRPGRHPGLDGIVSWWHDGPLGRIRLDQGFVRDEEEHGAVLLANPTGRLADLVDPLLVRTDFVDVAVTEGNLNYADLVARFA